MPHMDWGNSCHKSEFNGKLVVNLVTWWKFRLWLKLTFLRIVSIYGNKSLTCLFLFNFREVPRHPHCPPPSPVAERRRVSRRLCSWTMTPQNSIGRRSSWKSLTNSSRTPSRQSPEWRKSLGISFWCVGSRAFVEMQFVQWTPGACIDSWKLFVEFLLIFRLFF